MLDLECTHMHTCIRDRSNNGSPCGPHAADRTQVGHEWMKHWLACSVATVVSPASDINHADLLAVDVDKDAVRKHANSAASGIPGRGISQGDGGLWAGVVTMAAEALVCYTWGSDGVSKGYWQNINNVKGVLKVANG